MSGIARKRLRRPSHPPKDARLLPCHCALPRYDRSRLYPERSVTPGISASATSPPIMDAQPCQASTTRNRAGSLAGTTLTNTTLTNTHPTYISPPPVNPNPATGAYAAQEAPFGQVSPSLGIQLRHQSPAALAGMQSLQGVTNQYHFYAPMPSQPALPVLAAPSSSVLHGSPSCAGAALSAPTDDLRCVDLEDRAANFTLPYHQTAVSPSILAIPSFLKYKASESTRRTAYKTRTPIMPLPRMVTTTAAPGRI